VNSRGKVGRPTKLSKISADERARLLALLRVGTPKSWACRAIGLSPQTLELYRQRADRGETPFLEFIRDVDQAQAIYVNRCLRILDADAIGAPLTDGRERGNGHLKWILERLFPADFGWRRTLAHRTNADSRAAQRPPRLVILSAADAAE